MYIILHKCVSENAIKFQNLGKSWEKALMDLDKRSPATPHRQEVSGASQNSYWSFKTTIRSHVKYSKLRPMT